MYMYVYNIVVSGNLQIPNHYNYEEDFSKKLAIFIFKIFRETDSINFVLFNCFGKWILGKGVDFCKK